MNAHHGLPWAFVWWLILSGLVVVAFWVWNKSSIAHRRRSDRRFYASLARFEAAKQATPELPLLPPSEYRNV